ncbi:MAG: MarR family winged helix-turn-helix transcriptional regulator [Candidatus Sulfotelmatobacter sp.]
MQHNNGSPARNSQEPLTKTFSQSSTARVHEIVAGLSVAVRPRTSQDNGSHKGGAAQVSNGNGATANTLALDPAAHSVSVSPADQQSTSSAFAALRTASRAITQFYDLVLAPTGLKGTQFVILQAIHEAGEVAQCDFARDFAIAVPTLSRRFGGLRRKDYIQIRRGDRHGERIYSLTEKGVETFKNALPYWERAQYRLRMALGEDSWARMLELTDRIRQAAVDAEQLRTDNQRPVSMQSGTDTVLAIESD